MGSAAILVVEDDRNVAELLGVMLRREGFEPTLLADGRAAEVHVAGNDPPAAVVLDIMLPYRDGFAVASAIRADSRWKDVPIVMLTARALPADVERARALGIAEYVAKPFRPHELLGRIRTLLGEAG